jgi:flagellin
VGVAGTVAITAGAGLATAGATQITTGTSSTVTLTAGAITTGTTFRVDIGGVGNRVEYISRANDSLNDVSRNLKSLIEAKGIPGISVTSPSVADPTATNSVLNITNNSGATLSLASSSLTGGTPGGGLTGLDSINVETDAAGALDDIEGLLTVAINAAAALGSSQKRIENQGDFMITLIDSITSGVGALTDADMEAASAMLQALQVQQQLGTQALSIANQGSQSLLALFRQ